MEENKLTLSDLQNETEEQEKPKISKEEIMATMKANQNAQAYKERKRKELEEQTKAQAQQQQELSEKEQQEHMQRVYEGQEAPANAQEMYDGIYNNIQKTMERKKIEKQIIDEHFEQKEEDAKEEQEIEDLLNGRAIESDIPQRPSKDIKEALEEDEDGDLDDILGDDIDYDLDDDLDEDDDDEEEEDDDEEEKEEIEPLIYTDEERIEVLSKKAKEKIKAIEEDKIIDLANFKVANKKLSVNKVVKITNTEPNLSNWGLFNTGIPILMEEFKGQELATISELISSEDKTLTEYNKNRQLYRMIYDHDKSESKPDSFTEWLKQISIRDNDNLFMAVYRASYAGANYIPYTCPHCGEIFVTDSLPLYQHIKFADKKDEEKAQEILDMIERKPVELPVNRVQISENYVMDFRDPSLYNIMIECAVLDDEYRRTHADLISYISYIDNIYYINREQNILEPIDLVKFDKNLKKEIASKIKRYAKILKELTEDQLNLVAININNIVELQNVDVKYVLPEMVCPRCGKTIEEIPTIAQSLVFTRHQLALLATM